MLSSCSVIELRALELVSSDKSAEIVCSTHIFRGFAAVNNNTTIFQSFNWLRLINLCYLTLMLFIGVVYALHYGADPNITDNSGNTPLHLAIENCHEIVCSAENCFFLWFIIPLWVDKGTSFYMNENFRGNVFNPYAIVTILFFRYVRWQIFFVRRNAKKVLRENLKLISRTSMGILHCTLQVDGASVSGF